MPAADYSKTQRIALTSLISALCVAIMTVSRMVPVGIYAIPPICSVFVMIVLIECGTSWAVGCYIVTSVVSIIVANPESCMVFVAIFGYYPILKLYIERIRFKAVKWLVKIVLFNAVVVGGYYVLNLITPVLSDVFSQGMWYLAVLAVMAQVMFVLYDICIARLSMQYMYRYHRIVRKIFKK